MLQISANFIWIYEIYIASIIHKARHKVTKALLLKKLRRSFDATSDNGQNPSDLDISNQKQCRGGTINWRQNFNPRYVYAYGRHKIQLTVYTFHNIARTNP